MEVKVKLEVKIKIERRKQVKVAESIFEYTKPLPKSEDYGLTSQIR
ncbi:MAG TPA: hypothetical protein ENH53_11845 [Bacteroidetes bacterium]|nr:hypothetical protein [Bacteroidota bacterium]